MRSIALLVLLGACAPMSDPGWSRDEELSAGAATVFDARASAFTHPVANLDRAAERAFYRGKAFFEDPWVAAPSSTDSRDGLGPLFNARACSDCHARLGRGKPPSNDEKMFSMIVRISAMDADGQASSHPIYGHQIQPRGIPGVPGEGEIHLSYHEYEGELADGTHYELRHPILDASDLVYGAPEANAAFSARVAPALVGNGLLEAIVESDLIALADPDDADGDGISGRARHVIDPFTNTQRVGRFGWKAGQASLEHQVAGAFVEDMGLTTNLYSEERCTAMQPECESAPNGGHPEIADSILADTAHFLRAIAVPARRGWALPTVRRGQELFEQLGCAGCHVPEHTTGAVPGMPQLSGQIIRPYTDLLLHDMGDELADHRPEGEASGSEWKTPPLWGLGLSRVVNHHGYLLHDGRARSIHEAILWHGGEGQAARDAYANLPSTDRDYVIDFLESL